ncbi:nuclear transport factor 2 family protein [Streptomyces canus]|uniref:nuclear transport factor 2 family protein n=1 Tax=Streptomyces canus TaxID=58343 RepID=UPI002E2B8CDC|nr:nuclear transport factor 2 family protein [Streptomyces canus]
MFCVRTVCSKKTSPVFSAAVAVRTRLAATPLTVMFPDCVIVQGPVGNVHERERFLAYDASMGATVEAETSEVTCRERGGRAIVTCFQKMRIRRLPDLPPFLVQAVATRVWFSTDEGWRLGHMQLSRRQPSA